MAVGGEWENNGAIRKMSDSTYHPKLTLSEAKKLLHKLGITAEPFEGKFGRNEPCPCGSGKKFKFCCGKGMK